MTRSNGQFDPASQAEREREAQQDSQNLSSGMPMQQEQLREVLMNPDVIETLSDADLEFDNGQTNKAWLADDIEEFLGRDQVMANRSRRNLWERTWTNPNLGDQLVMSYPHPESRTSNKRVERVRQRIRGDEKRPLTPEEKVKIRRSLSETKTDRESRAKNAKYMELLLTQVVTSNQSTKTDEGNRSFFDRLLGGGN